MKQRKPSGPVVEAVQEVISESGYTLVEFSAERVKGRTHVHCVLFHPDGVSLDALGLVHSALQPRLEVLLEDDDPYIEFSSPGIERKLKSFHEFQAFAGCTVAVIPINETEWLHGRIEAADDESCTISDQNGERHTFSPDEVVKARLAD